MRYPSGNRPFLSDFFHNATSVICVLCIHYNSKSTYWQVSIRRAPPRKRPPDSIRYIPNYGRTSIEDRENQMGYVRARISPLWVTDGKKISMQSMLPFNVARFSAWMFLVGLPGSHFVDSLRIFFCSRFFHDDCHSDNGNQIETEPNHCEFTA